jgi:hypothetical protein
LDLEIGCALQTPFEFVGAIAGKDEMGVRIAKAGQDDFAAGINFARVRIGKGEEIERITNGNNSFALDRYRTIANDCEIGLGGTAFGGGTGQRQNLVGGMDKEVGGW